LPVVGLTAFPEAGRGLEKFFQCLGVGHGFRLDTAAEAAFRPGGAG
jgi:hypothetical protein